jgi:hypothetical protein
MRLIIEKLSTESNVPVNLIGQMVEEISASLVKEGCAESEPRFMKYLIRRLRKRLKIEESTTYKSFKQFFNS